MRHDGNELSEASWENLFRIWLTKSETWGCSVADNRLFLNAVMCVVRHGGTWQVVTERFGRYDTVCMQALRGA